MADISQAAPEIGTFVWNEGDPVSLSWRVDANWAGSYICQIRKIRKSTGTLVGALTITAEWDTIAYPSQTLFTMTMSEANSELIPAGNYFTDMQLLGGVTRIWGKVRVDPQVSIDP